MIIFVWYNIIQTRWPHIISSSPRNNIISFGVFIISTHARTTVYNIIVIERTGSPQYEAFVERTVTIATTAPKHRDLTGTPTPPRPAPFKTYCLTTIMRTIIIGTKFLIILRLIIIIITCYSTFATHKPAPAACHVHPQPHSDTVAAWSRIFKRISK